MSRLTDHQVKAMISSLRSTVRMLSAQGDTKRAIRAHKKLRGYEDELAARQRGAARQEPQAVRFGER